MNNRDEHFGLDQPEAVEGLVMGFDFGMKRIGVAVGQSLTCSASALPVLAARDGIPDWDELAALVSHWQPKAFLVGIPLNMDGTEQEITHAARKFARRIKHFHKLPVFGVDERLTSAEVKQDLFEQGGYKRLKQKPIDSYAAQLIVESWLKQCVRESIKKGLDEPFDECDSDLDW